MSDQRDKPALDESALAKLLEAAYVLQEHRRVQEQLDLSLELQSDHLREQEQLAAASPPDSPAGPRESHTPKGDYTLTLAQIVKTQHQIRVRQLNLEQVMALVAERATTISGASGAGIGILEEKGVRYRATSGHGALPPGTQVQVEKALCCACLRTGQAIRCTDVNPEFLLDPEECLRRGIQALIAVPVYHNGEISGALELYFAKPRSFTEQEVHTGQLMAGLVTEAFARDADVAFKRSLATERAAMLEALEKLRPNLAAFAGGSESSQNAEGMEAISVGVAAGNFVCRKCAHELMAEEQFCGKCGAPRLSDQEPSSLQSKLASLWHEQQAAREIAPPAPVNGNGTHTDIPFSLDPADLEKLQSGPLEPFPPARDRNAPPPAGAPAADSPAMFDPELEMQIKKMVETLAAEDEARQADVAGIAPAMSSRAGLPHADVEMENDLASDPAGDQIEAPETSTALAKTDDVTWTSAAKARDFLEQLAASRDQSPFARFWKARRGDIYLAVAVVLVAIVIRWGIWSNPSVAATGNPSAGAGRRRPAPDADLSLFDKFLISVGLAEAPETPEYKGNPTAQVWVDLHTALYYCQGADLYGKTPKGKFTSQRDAQLDQFEPASRRACD